MFVFTVSSGRRIFRWINTVQDALDRGVHGFHAVLQFEHIIVVDWNIHRIHECAILVDHSGCFVSYSSELYCLKILENCSTMTSDKVHWDFFISAGMFYSFVKKGSSIVMILMSRNIRILKNGHPWWTFDRPQWYICSSALHLLDTFLYNDKFSMSTV